MHISAIFLASFLFALFSSLPISANESERLSELDAYWAEVSRAIREGDFEGYKATCHEEGVLVSGAKKASYPLTKALAGWKQGIDDTKAGKNQASVAFRFSQRLGDDSTAHETGIFLYSNTNSEGIETKAYIHFEALLVKKDKWLILMEYQKSEATEREWAALKHWEGNNDAPFSKGHLPQSLE